MTLQHINRHCYAMQLPDAPEYIVSGDQLSLSAVPASGAGIVHAASSSTSSAELPQHKQTPLDPESAQHEQPAAVDGASKPAWQDYNSVFTAAKAGMQNVDKEKVKKIVYEMSKDSAHFRNEQRKQAQVDAKIAQLKAKVAALSTAELAGFQKSCDAKITQLEATRDLTKTWLHVDMDAFYASVEELDQPELKNKPMAVGGIGMICTANYEARKYGVRSAMPGFIARKLCPQLVFVKPDFVKYTAASEQTRAVFRLYDPAFEAGSLDEAYLDITAYCKEHGVTGEQVAAELRAKVTAATQLTCSVGVAPNVMLAKVASDMNKPNGQAKVEASRDAVMAFVHDLPIRKIPGIGKVSEQTLNALDINTCSQVIQQRAYVAALLSSISCNFLLSVGLGLGATEHSSRGGGEDNGLPGRKGISCERTFSAMSAPAALEQMADTLVQHLAADMAAEDIEAKTLTLKLKTTDFHIRTRAATLPNYVSTAAQMLPPISKLLKAELPVEIRLMGVRGSNLRKIQKQGAISAAGSKLNALQRMVLQGRKQQQPREQQQQQQQQYGGQHLQDGQQGIEWHDNEQQQQQQQQHHERLDLDVLDEGQCGSEPASGDADGDSDNDVTIVSQPNDSDTRADWGWQQLQQQQPQQPCLQAQQQPCLQAQQQWHQIKGLGDPVAAHIEQLHQQVLSEGRIQRQTQPDSAAVEPAYKRTRLNQEQQVQLQEQQSCAEGQCYQASGTVRHGSLIVAGQRYKASELPMDWQQQQQHDVQQKDPQDLQQLPHALKHQQPMQPPQHQHHHQQYYHAAVPHEPKPQQPCYNSPPAAGTADGQATAASNTGDDGFMLGKGPEPHRQQQQWQQEQLGSTSRAKSTWACLACTYSSNKAILLRCQVCDTPKGDSSAPPAGWLCTKSSGASGSGKVASGSKQQSRNGRAKQMRLDSVVQMRANNVRRH